MANRYWVGGTATWDATAGAKWALTSGGAGGQAVPTASDDVFFDAASGAATVAIGTGATGLSLTLTGFTGTMAYGANSITLAGNNATIFAGAATYSVTGTPLIVCNYAGATGTRNITPGGTTEANAVSFSVTAGTDTVAVLGASSVKNLDFTGFSGTYAVANNTTCYGNFTLSTGLTTSGAGNTLTFGATSGTQLVTSNGKSMDRAVAITSTATVRLVDSLSIGATRNFTHSAGTLDINGKTLTVGLFSSSNSTTRTIAFGTAGVIVVTGSGATAFTAATSTNLTVTGTGTISMTSASAKTFVGGGMSWPALSQGGAGALTITGANTFSDIANTVNGTTVTLPASTTTTVAALTLTGGSGSLTTLQSSSAGVAATLSKASGTVSTTYLSIKDITVTGGATWLAPLNQGNVDAGGNSGWSFVASGGGRHGLRLGLGLSL